LILRQDGPPTLICFAYYFPPVNEVASLRAKYFVSAALDNGWHCHVVTTNFDTSLGSIDWIELKSNENLTISTFGGETKSSANVRCMSLANFLRAAIKPMAREIIRRLPFHFLEPAESWKRLVSAAIDCGSFDHADAIWSTSGPVQSHILARKLTKRCTSAVTWVADFRDPWSGSHFFKLLIGNRLQRALEKRCLKTADHITCVSMGHAKYLANLHGKKIKVFYNGFEDENYIYNPKKSIELRKIFRGGYDFEPVIIAHTGTIYGHFDKIKISAFVNDVLSACDKAIFVFYGNDQLGLKKQFINEPRAFFCGIQSRSDTLVLQNSADRLLLLLEPKKKNNSQLPNTAVISTKAFEYIKSGKPVIALGDTNPEKNEALKLIEANNELLYINDTIGRLEHLKVAREIKKNYMAQRLLPPPSELYRRNIMNRYLKLFGHPHER